MFAIEQSLVVEGKANTHLTHLEELVLTQGNEGYQLARTFLLELLETLKGNSKSRVSTSVKWDGAPAIFAGRGLGGRFFVGTKSVNNAEPKINYTTEDIINNHSKAEKDDDGNYVPDEEGNVDHGGLVDKLLRALEELPKLGIKNILQGDFMFDDTMLSTVNIDGEPHYRFKPNTIIYTVPIDSELGREIGRSKFGIVFHTTYGGVDEKGRPIDISYGADVSSLNRPPGIWFDDAFFDDDTGTVTLTADEESAVRTLIKQADSVNNKIDYNGIPSDFLNIYINNEIRQGQFLENPKESYDGFLGWYQSRIEKKIDSLKTEKGRMRAINQGEEKIKQFESKKEDILDLFKVSRLLFEAKNIFINKYNNAVYNTKHFIDDGSGDLVVTNPEGYVAVDHIGNGVKFVDRLEFSRANFLMDKGFKKDVNESQILEVFWGSTGYSAKMSLREWSQRLPKTTKVNKELFKKLSAGVPITSLILDGAKVKSALAEAVNWAVNEGDQKQVIAVYPGRFQPMGRHHFQTYQQVATENGIDTTFIATSNRTNSKSPLNFEEKKVIMNAHGVPESQIIQVKNPYYAKELSDQFEPENIEMVYFVGAKDMATNPRFKKTSGITKEGVSWRIVVAPHVEIDLPGYGAMSGTTLRSALKNASPEEFKAIMGWYNEDVYNILSGALSEMSAMSGGAVALGARKSRRTPKVEENEQLVNEVMNYLLGITVG